MNIVAPYHDIVKNVNDTINLIIINTQGLKVSSNHKICFHRYCEMLLTLNFKLYLYSNLHYLTVVHTVTYLCENKFSLLFLTNHKTHLLLYQSTCKVPWDIIDHTLKYDEIQFCNFPFFRVSFTATAPQQANNKIMNSTFTINL